MLTAADLEGPEFWTGVKVVRPDPARGPAAWLAGVAAVVQPALVEEQPRRLLEALAAGVPVLATCGLNDSKVVDIKPLDSADLVTALQQVLGGRVSVDRPGVRS